MQPHWYTNAVEWDVSAMDSLNRLQYYHDTQWTTCNEQTADQFSAIAFAFGRMLSDSLQVPVGLILNAIGGSGTEAWIDRKTLEFDFTDILYDWTQNDFIQDWVRGRAMLNTKKSTNKLQRHPYEPCYLYETGIEPLQQYPIKGVIWYQGESNAQNIETHERLFPLLVSSWRRKLAGRASVLLRPVIQYRPPQLDMVPQQPTQNDGNNTELRHGCQQRPGRFLECTSKIQT